MFGALTYKTVNLGDDIQTLAAVQYLPKVSQWVDRDDMGSLPDGPTFSMFLNGWFGSSIKSWPPHPRIRPLLLSFHLNALNNPLFEPEKLEYLQRFGPVGCRDLRTLELLEDWGIPAFFSGCLTLTLEPRSRTPGDHILCVDLAHACSQKTSRACKHRLEASNKEIRFWSHWIPSTLTPAERFIHAHRALDSFSSASLVVTSRLHCALPCLALGVPVLFVLPEIITGRLGGLAELTRCCSAKEFLDGDLEELLTPQPNPEDFRPVADSLRLRAGEFVSSALTAPQAP